MSHRRMHDDEVDTDVDMVRGLLASQHPQWAHLPIERVRSAGTDNAMYRLGDELAVRLPRIGWAVETVAKEQRWLPFLGRQLPLDVPLPVAAGEPDDVFPYPWGVVRWVHGDVVTLDALDDPGQAARALAEFVVALRAIDPGHGPTHRRGRPVRLQDDAVRKGVAGLRGELDGRAVIDAWERVLDVPDYNGPPLWSHGDLSYLNLVARDGRLRGVVDWGTCGVGDPAIDAIVAWSLFPSDVRKVYRDELDIDDATWERGKGWVLCGVGGVSYYRDTNPVLVADKIASIEALLADGEPQ